MGILGIRNRTENWKTVENFHALSDDAKVKLVQRLLEPYQDAQEVAPDSVKVELFWKGIRDYEESISATQCKDVYQSLFGSLRGEIKAFIAEARSARRRPLNDLQDWNYRVSDDIFASGAEKPSPEALKDNLRNTEIDIVLETPSHLFIGEAKDESDLDGDSRYVLVHQLIRQYVLAKILLTILGEDRKIVQFIVGPEVEDLKKKEQVKFVEKQGWLKENNILSWDCVKAIREPSP
jgi:hypothetical protein